MQRKTLDIQGIIYYMEEPAGFEPAIRELQSHALPLGYGSMCIYIIANYFCLYNIFYEKSLDLCKKESYFSSFLLRYIGTDYYEYLIQSRFLMLK